MKIYFLITFFILFASCQQFKSEEDLNYFQFEGIKIKELTNFNKSYVSKGSYKRGNDTVISMFEIESKYSLLVIKLKNVSKDYTLNYHSNVVSSSPGFFSVIVASEVYDVTLSPSIFKNDFKINNIDFTSENQISSEINNDTIKSFSLNFNEFKLKINDQDDKIVTTDRIEYYGLENLSANFLFYKIDDEIYLFIMTPNKGKGTLENDTLYNYLFPIT
ncbi:MAG TPA: hypothetical protein VFS71_10795 [Flavobacterium sp.]|uniref:hypothetical protein n=1 Tax=Flavobacterium sp. TaxID=239 RepID=UPI002DBAEBFB|nr:hypothetical protein [Flavobacterium sp.]HEU4790165.1 hypothetical protein [Flavobacterium sp.]